MTPEQQACAHAETTHEVGTESKISLWVCRECGLRSVNAYLPVNLWDPEAVEAERRRQEAARVALRAENDALKRSNGSKP